MKPFKFSLESLREPRRRNEQAAQQRYAQALAACDRAAAQLENAALELKANRNQLSYELANGASMDTINTLRRWCEALASRRDQCKAAFDEARRSAGIAFQQMADASRERDALDRFFEKARRAYDQKIRSTEQKILDEVAIRFRDANHLLRPSPVKI